MFMREKSGARGFNLDMETVELLLGCPPCGCEYVMWNSILCCWSPGAIFNRLDAESGVKLVVDDDLYKLVASVCPLDLGKSGLA